MKIAPIACYYIPSLETATSLNKINKYQYVTFDLEEEPIPVATLSPPVIEQDFYRPSELNNDEDSYIKLLQRQRNFIPHVNLFYVAWQRSIRIFNSPVFVMKRAYRYVENIARSSLLKSDKRKRSSSAFVAITNLAEE
ncbi:hypothetical protein M997_0543 [Proteus hauseri ATCC 700826]|uniref:Uncharacterized protein n=1 Tax=Proteus hauseri ATCC 700826 TaxID=1354271 RepID=A0AAJ3HU71_PROHU|nr:hypothetical protein [Proteus hauseri]OAT49333.1 hypothetical protein M997_0543 [Proteus hauseri ATCC 700826]